MRFGIPDHFDDHDHVFIWARFSEPLFHDKCDIPRTRGIESLSCLCSNVRFFRHDPLFHAYLTRLDHGMVDHCRRP